MNFKVSQDERLGFCFPASLRAPKQKRIPSAEAIVKAAKRRWANL